MKKESNHYKICKPEAIELIDRYYLNFTEGNIIKYILRSPFKGDRLGDLKKALYYAKKLPKECKLTWDNRHRGKFDIDELDQYLDSHVLYAVEVDAVASVIHGNFYHTVSHDDSGKRILEYKENYIAKLIEIAIDQRKHNEKMEEVSERIIKGLSDYKYKHSLSEPRPNNDFNPDWLPPHPLYTLLELIDEDPEEILIKLDKIENKAIIEAKDKYYLDSIAYLICLIKGNIREIEILSKIGGSKEFWRNLYDNYWEKRNQSVTK